MPRKRKSRAKTTPIKVVKVRDSFFPNEPRDLGPVLLDPNANAKLKTLVLRWR